MPQAALGVAIFLEFGVGPIPQIERVAFLSSSTSSAALSPKKSTAGCIPYPTKHQLITRNCEVQGSNTQLVDALA